MLTEADLPVPAAYAHFHPFLKGVFSQWHPTTFVLDDRSFVTAEQWMMFAKARLFGDQQSAEAILATPDPAIQKRLGQHVAGFEEAVWSGAKLDIVARGSRAKFEQNEGARQRLLATGEAMLVEANRLDWIWGCGLSADDPRIDRPAEWPGSNLLGRILTMIRDDLKAAAAAD